MLSRRGSWPTGFLPLTLDIDQETAQSIAMNNNTTVVVGPDTLPLAVQAVIVMVASYQVPVAADKWFFFQRCQ